MRRNVLGSSGRAPVTSGALLLSPDDAPIGAEALAEQHPAPSMSHASKAQTDAHVSCTSPARLAWERRAWILSPEHHAGRAREFVVLALDSAHQAIGANQAAEALSVTRQHLARLTAKWFELPPKVVIDLARIMSLARELVDSDRSLKSIGRGYAFKDAAHMSRMFTRFLGIPPGLFRGLMRGEEIRKGC